MSSTLRGLKVAVLGGDKRQQVLIDELVMLGASIHVVGLPVEPNTRVKEFTTVTEAIQGVSAIILPMPGVNNDASIHAVFSKANLLFTPEIVEMIPPNVPIIVGSAKQYLKAVVADKGRRLIEIGEMDDVAILNSIPSAEGAIQIAMEELPITIHGSKSFVIGYGRVGITLARMLQGIGAQVYVVARKSADMARIQEAGYKGVPFKKMELYLGDANIIFNTVPAMILNDRLLLQVNREALIVDLASSPGGTDFKTAANLGINAILAPGLPGKVAPKTAGLILARVIPKLIEEALGL